MAKKLPKQVQTLIDEITKEDAEIVKPGKKLKLSNLYLYYYPDPKTKAKLDVYDTLPLIVLLDVPDGKYVLGINLHYIPYLKRLQFMKGLMGKGTKIKYSDIQKAWKDAKIPNAYANLAIRKYLVNRIASNIRVFEDPEDQYRIVKEVLPDFKKKSMPQVYRDIEKQLTRQRKKNK
jgi:hypothetical protein